jgi:tetrahydromethanopterin S-methyltransferase subunit G
MNDDKLRGELAGLFRFGAKPSKGPKVTLTPEQFENLVERLRALRDQVEQDNERLIQILKEKD